jgi:hypothetical protein
MPAAMAPMRAMPEPTWKLEAAPVDSGASELVPVPWKPASLVAVALLRELVVVAVRVAMLMVVLRDMEAPVPEAMGAVPVPAGVTGTADMVPLVDC